jgi:hypothetical protein
MIPNRIYTSTCIWKYSVRAIEEAINVKIMVKNTGSLS